MSEKTYIYEWGKEDLANLRDIETEALKKADELNDKLLDIKIMMDEVSDDWNEYLNYLEDEGISRMCEFRGGQCIDFSDEVRNAIVNTLIKSLNDTQKSANYNMKKIKLNQVIDG